jgi:hypothetical protein
MNKEELYNLALSNVHKYNLLNELFSIRDKRTEIVDYTIGVNGFISLDVLNKYVNKIDENTNLKQALNEVREFIAKAIQECTYGQVLVYQKILEIIDKYMKEDD